MRDRNIRHLLQRTELAKYLTDPQSIVIEEMDLPVAKARIDIAVINGHLHGYEIKSASDTLQRLPSQLIAYSKVFDYLTVVTEDKYREKILKILPTWVGLAICSDKNCGEEFKVIKFPKLNLNREGFYLCKLLWRPELTAVLEENKIAFRKKDRNWVLCEIISKNIELEILSDIVRQKLKNRINWRTSSIKGYEEA